MSSVVIVGAGISGLTIAFRLQQAIPSCEITVLEKSDRPGGAVWTERQDGFQVEFGPNGFLDNKSSTLDLCRDLGIADRLIPASDAAAQNRYLFFNGNLQSLPTGLRTFLASNLLTWHGKLSLLAEFLRPGRVDPTDESVDSFVRRRVGKEVADIFADALVTGIYAGDPKLLSLPAAFPRLAQWERDYGSISKGLLKSMRQRVAGAERSEAPVSHSKPGLRGFSPGHPRQRSRMWSFSDGLRVLIDSLSERLQKPPVISVTVRQIEKARDLSLGGSSWWVLGDGTDHWPADAVVLACPAYQQAALLGDLDQMLAERVGQISYNRLAVVALGYRQSDVRGRLDGFGYIAPQHTRRDVLGVQWCSSIFPARASTDTVLLRAMCGGWNRPEVVGWEDDRLLEAVRAELRLTMNIVAAPVFQRTIRWDRAIPQYHVGHLERVGWIEKRLAGHPGLFLAGNAYHGVALNDCTEQAEIVAARVGEFLATTAKRSAGEGANSGR